MNITSALQLQAPALGGNVFAWLGVLVSQDINFMCVYFGHVYICAFVLGVCDNDKNDISMFSGILSKQ